MKLSRDYVIENTIISKGTVIEAKQRGVLYHFTAPFKAERIIESDKLESKSNIVYNEKNYFQISTTRNYNLIDVIDTSELWGTVRFTLNGDALSNQYKIVPYDDLLDAGKEYRRGESEEAIIAKVISPLSKYVLQIDIIKDKAYYTGLEYTLMQETIGKNGIRYWKNVPVQFVSKFLPYKYQKA